MFISLENLKRKVGFKMLGKKIPYELYGQPHESNFEQLYYTSITEDSCIRRALLLSLSLCNSHDALQYNTKKKSSSGLTLAPTLNKKMFIFNSFSAVFRRKYEWVVNSWTTKFLELLSPKSLSVRFRGHH